MVLPALLVSTFSFFTACSPSGTTVYINHSDTVNYVGKAACASCHQENFESFIHTGMGRSFGSANLARSSADFNREHLVTDSSTGLNYIPVIKGNDLYIREFLIDQGDTVHQLLVKIDFIVGSGQHTNSHMVKVGEYVYQAPLTYYTQEAVWDLPPGFKGNNSRFSRMIDLECMSCHNAMPVMKEGSNFRFDQIAEGIDCERCHGPGEAHVNFQRSTDGQGKGDPRIINPSKLPLERQIDICQRCHLQGLNILQEGKSFSDFRPGMVLSDIFEVYLPAYSNDGEVIDMANHAQRFQQSACFKNSKEDAFSCISCHNPHISVRNTPTKQFDGLCMECHTVTEHSTETDGSSCVSCHMPEVTTNDIGHVRIHDHKIGIYQPQEINVQIGKLIGLYAVNNSAPSMYNLTRAYLEYWEKFDKNPFYLKKAEELLAKHEFKDLTLKYHYLKEEYQKVIDLASDIEDMGDWYAYMIGQSYLNLGRRDEAEIYFRISYKENPDRVEVGVKLAKLYMADLNGELLEVLLDDLYARFPVNGDVLNIFGEWTLKKGNKEKGKALLTKALMYDPFNVTIWENFFNLSLLEHNSEASDYWARRILGQLPEHSQKEILKSYIKSP